MGSVIKVSRKSGVKPNVSQISFDELSWNIVDGILYGKGLDEFEEEIIIAIAGMPSETVEETDPLFTDYIETERASNTVLAGPVSGAAAAPTFRALVADDIPDLSSVYLTEIPAASDTVRGGLKTGFSESAAYLALRTNEERGYITLTKSAVEEVLTGTLTSHSHTLTSDLFEGGSNSLNPYSERTAGKFYMAALNPNIGTTELKFGGSLGVYNMYVWGTLFANTPDLGGGAVSLIDDFIVKYSGSFYSMSKTQLNSVMTLTGLADVTFSTYVADKWIKVNSAGTGIELVDAPSSAGTLVALTDTPSSIVPGKVLIGNAEGTAFIFTDLPDGDAYILPVASSTTRGGIKIGYTATGANIPVQLLSEKAYVALTKSAIENVLTGAITSHTHAYDNYSSFSVVASNTGGSATVSSGETLTFEAGSNMSVTRDGRKIIFTSSGGEGGGTVLSVGLSVPTGFSVTGSPITVSGTLALAFASGYSLPTAAKQINWDNAYGWGNHAIQGYLTSLPSHTHGAITSSGTIASDTTIANGHKIVITDGSSIIRRSSIAFGTSQTTFLREDGTWAVPSGGGSYTLPLAANGTRGGIQIGYTATGANIPVQLSSEKAYVALTQEAVETVLTGAITSHTHSYGSMSRWYVRPNGGTSYSVLNDHVVDIKAGTGISVTGSSASGLHEITISASAADLAIQSESSNTFSVSLSSPKLHKRTLSASGSITISAGSSTAAKTAIIVLVSSSSTTDRSVSWTGTGVKWQDDISLNTVVGGWTYIVTATNTGSSVSDVVLSFVRVK